MADSFICHVIEVACQEQSHLSMKRRSEANSLGSEGNREGYKEEDRG